MNINSPYPKLSENLYATFREFVNNNEVNHSDLYNTLLMFVGGIVKITHNKGVPEFSEEQRTQLAMGLKKYFNQLIDIAIYDEIH